MTLVNKIKRHFEDSENKSIRLFKSHSQNQIIINSELDSLKQLMFILPEGVFIFVIHNG